MSEVKRYPLYNVECKCLVDDEEGGGPFMTYWHVQVFAPNEHEAKAMARKFFESGEEISGLKVKRVVGETLLPSDSFLAIPGAELK